MQLLIDVLRDPDPADLVDVAGTRSERHTIEHVDERFVVVRNRRCVGARIACGQAESATDPEQGDRKNALHLLVRPRIGADV